MSFIQKISKLFSKKQSSDLLGISLRQNSLAYCYIPSISDAERSSRCQNIELNTSDVATQFADFGKLHQVKGQCQLILSSSQYQIVQVDKPDVPESEIAGALKWQIKELVTYSPEDMLLDYFNSPTLPDGSEKLYVVCTALSPLKDLVHSLLSEEITLTAITIEEFAFARLLSFSDDAQMLVCQQPNEDVFILIIKQGQICFHRRLRGFAQLASKTEEELSYGLIDTLSLEIQKSSDYFERQLKQSMIRAIKVILPITTETYLIGKLAENTNIPVTPLELPETFSACRDMAAAIGATMPDNATEPEKAGEQA